MTPKRQLWWESISPKEQYLRNLMAKHKRSLKYCKISLADEYELGESEYYKKYIKIHKTIITLCKHEIYNRYTFIPDRDFKGRGLV